MTFSATGFNSLRYEAVDQTVGATTTLNPTLTLAGQGAQVTVREAIPRVDESSATLAASVEERAIDDLPLNGRNWTSLTSLMPGAIDQGGSNAAFHSFRRQGPR